MERLGILQNIREKGTVMDVLREQREQLAIGERARERIENLRGTREERGKLVREETKPAEEGKEKPKTQEKSGKIVEEQEPKKHRSKRRGI